MSSRLYDGSDAGFDKFLMQQERRIDPMQQAVVQTQERRIDPILDDKVVTYDQMSYLLRDQGQDLTKEQLAAHWNNLARSPADLPQGTKQAAELAELFQQQFGAPMPSLTGDFYREPDDVVRGITLAESFSTMDVVGCSLDDHYMAFSADIKGPALDETRFGKCGASSSQSSTFFQTTDVPPPLSEEMRLLLEKSTLHLSQHSPAAAGNLCLKFFREIVDASITKFREKKFIIRALAVFEGLPCDVKVRIYQGEAGGSVVEFQKRSGDSLAFMWMFRLATKYFEDPASRPVHAKPPELPPVVGSVELLPEHAIAPLLGIAGTSEDVNELSSVASTLCAMAEDPKIAEQLRQPCAFSVVQRLQQVKDFRVAFPTSRLVSRI